MAEIRQRRPRLQDDDADAVLADLLQHRPGESDHRPFRRRVGRTPGHGVAAGERGQVHVGAAFLAPHDGDGGLHQQEGPPEVRPVDPVEFRGIHVLEQPLMPDAGVVHHHVEAAEAAGRGLHQPRRHALLGHVAGQGFDLGTPRPQRAGGRLQPFRRPGPHDQPRALRRQGFGDGQPDAPAGPGDDRDGLAQIHLRRVRDEGGPVKSSSAPSGNASSQALLLELPI